MDPVTQTVLNKVVGLGLERVLKPFVENAERSLSSIESLILQESERNRVVHLRKAVHYILDGDKLKAESELVDATALDPNAAVPALLLGLLLQESRAHATLGAAYISKALAINPFLIHSLEGPESQATGMAIPSASDYRREVWNFRISGTTISAVSWANRKWHDRARMIFDYIRFAGQLSVPFGQFTTLRAAATPDSVVLTYVASEDLRHPRRSGLAVVSAGRILWLVDTRDILLFTGQSLIFCRDATNTALVTIRSLFDGRRIEVVSASYFDAMICPKYDIVECTSLFKAANIRMVSVEDALARLTYEGSQNQDELIDPGFDHRNLVTTLYDTHDAAAPSGNLAFTVSNRWNHHHFAGGNRIPTCGMYGSTFLIATQRKPTDPTDNH